MPIPAILDSMAACRAVCSNVSSVLLSGAWLMANTPLPAVLGLVAGHYTFLFIPAHVSLLLVCQSYLNQSHAMQLAAGTQLLHQLQHHRACLVLQASISAQLARESTEFVDLPLPPEALVVVQDAAGCREASSLLHQATVLGMDAEWQPSVTGARPLPSLLQVRIFC